MTNWIDLINFGVVCSGLTITLIGLFLAFSATHMEKHSRVFFKVFFIITTFYISSDILSQISLVMLGEEYSTLSKIAVFSESLFSSILMPLLTFYLLKCVNENPWKSPIMYGVFSLHFIYFVILIITQFTKSIYYITEKNEYNRGRLYPLLLIPPVLLMILNLIIYMRRRKLLSKRQKTAFSIYLIVPIFCMIIQMFAYGLLLIVIGTSVASLFMFLFIVIDQREHHIKQLEENLEAQASVKMLQMRPHFIYNTMTSIYYLCEQDPEKAKHTINDFTNYLRKNFSAIAKTDTIPFKEELEHVQAYLAVEQARFEGELYVDFDTPVINFRIPPLTLQPIVENSVKYGVDPELDPLHISISTRETEKGVYITVADTGPGFDENSITEGDTREPRIAIKNIRERLEIMCNGTLSIKPGENVGTEAVIFIPNN